MQRRVRVSVLERSDDPSISPRARAHRRIPLRALLLAAALLATLLGWMVVHADTGRAIAWYPKQCAGFVDCTAKGLGNAGYQNVYTQSFWGAYGGHNCTNYVAYRLSQRGIAEFTVRGNADARNWGSQAQAKGYAVDLNIPQPGDIAWWTKEAMGNTGGHVAYVESVDVAAGTFVVSEDNYSGDFDWRTYRLGEVSGFIHVGGGTAATPDGFSDNARPPIPVSPSPVVTKPAATTRTIASTGALAVYRVAGVPARCVAPGGRFTLRASAVRRSASNDFRKVARVDFWGSGKRVRRDAVAPFTSAYVIPRTARPGQRIPVSAQVVVTTKKGATAWRSVRTTVRVCA